MSTSTDAFREFEHAGWNDSHVGQHYHENFGDVTMQSVNALLDAAGVVPGSLVLDVCTGAGYAAAAAVQRGAEVIGVDFSKAQAELARARYSGVRFEVDDGCALS